MTFHLINLNNGTPLLNFYKACFRKEHFLGDNNLVLASKRPNIDYIRIYSEINVESYVSFKYFKGVTAQMGRLIKNKNESCNELYSYNDETENGNRLMHIACLFSKGISNYFSFEARNKNGWTPFFSAAFANNQGAMNYLSNKCLSTENSDYFGNDAKFYMKQVPVIAIETAK